LETKQEARGLLEPYRSIEKGLKDLDSRLGRILALRRCEAYMRAFCAAIVQERFLEMTTAHRVWRNAQCAVVLGCEGDHCNQPCGS
ncbi:hypothetical protein CI238_11691, partial [Colletotrichum incanum]